MFMVKHSHYVLMLHFISKAFYHVYIFALAQFMSQLKNYEILQLNWDYFL